MTPERWQQIGSVLDRARALPADERPTFVDLACGNDPALRDDVASLLALDEEPAFLDRPVVDVHGEDPGVGQHVGPYELRRLLGRGGMGAVYLAGRRDDFRQRVALKLIQRGMDSDEVVRRFENERQILASLDHPNIARLLDGGTAADGRPYLVMEYVEGEPVDHYCERHKLTVRQRLELFLQICSAVHLSHQNLVIHRDLKPGNVLVTGDGVPKLLDFGIAKLLEPELAARTIATQPGQGPMTLRYASPEQVRGEAVTTASDTYSLGVLLYRLLTGRHPNDLDDAGVGTAEIVQRICEHEPPRPSTMVRGGKKVRGDKGGTQSIAKPTGHVGGGDHRRLSRRLAGDVDAIVLKALRKEPSQRYGFVEQFAEDIRRFLNGLPVVARRGTFTYRAGKFARRNRWALAVVALILGFSVATTMLWRQAVAERRQAIEERQRAEDVLLMLKDILKASDPSRPELPSVYEILERGRQKLGEALEEDSRDWAELVSVLGTIYRNLGRYEDARGLMEESLEIMRRQYAGDHPLLAEKINNLAVLCHDIGDVESAEEYSREALAMRRRLGQEDTIEIVKTLNNLASLLMHRGDFDEAERLYRRGLDIRVQRNGLEHPNVATSLRNLANLLFIRGEVAAAEPLLRRALNIRLKKYQRRHVRVASVLDKLASVRLAQGDEWEAAVLYSEALGIQREIRGEDHPLVARSQINLAALLLKQEASQEELATAALLLQQALATLAQRKPAGDWEIARAESLLGAYLARVGRHLEAESCLVEGHRVLRASRGSAIYTWDARQRLNELYRVWGKPGRFAGDRRAEGPVPEPDGREAAGAGSRAGPTAPRTATRAVRRRVPGSFPRRLENLQLGRNRGPGSRS